jgi:PadR family transcriptional regulator PadR
VPTSTPLGEFEVVVILAVLHLSSREEQAYGSTIRDEISERARRPFARGALYVTLDRLEAKGLLTSKLTGATPRRDNRPKRLFKVTTAGLTAVRQSVAVMTNMQRGLEPILEKP